MSNELSPPNYTQAPNIFFDEILSQITSLCELKVTLCIIRQTFGWQKEEDKISVTQLESLTGLSRKGVQDGLRLALERGYVVRRAEGQSYFYKLRVAQTMQQFTIAPCNIIAQPPTVTMQQSSTELCNDIAQSLCNDLAPQKKEEKKERNNSAQPMVSQRGAKKSVSRKSDARKRDPRSNHPAIQLVYQLTGYRPRMILYDDVIEALGEHPDFTRAKACALEWARRNARADNHGWIDWYVNGIPKNGGSNGGTGNNSGNAKPSLADRAKEYNDYYGTGKAETRAG